MIRGRQQKWRGAILVEVLINSSERVGYSHARSQQAYLTNAALQIIHSTTQPRNIFYNAFPRSSLI